MKNLQKITSETLELAMTQKDEPQGTTSIIGKYVIIRTYSAGVWAGFLKEKIKNEVFLGDARRLYYWTSKKGISLSGVSIHGIKKDASNICEAVKIVWLEAIEIIPCTELSQKSIINQPNFIK